MWWTANFFLRLFDSTICQSSFLCKVFYLFAASTNKGACNKEHQHQQDLSCIFFNSISRKKHIISLKLQQTPDKGVKLLFTLHTAGGLRLMTASMFLIKFSIEGGKRFCKKRPFLAALLLRKKNSDKDVDDVSLFYSQSNHNFTFLQPQLCRKYFGHKVPH